MFAVSRLFTRQVSLANVPKVFRPPMDSFGAWKRMTSSLAPF